MMTAIDGAGGITGAFTRLLAGLGTAAIDEEAATVARQCLLDWIGVSLAGRHEPLVDILVERKSP